MKISIIGNNKFHIKIEDTNFELNIKNLTMKDIISLSEINSTDWNTRKVIKAGISAELPVFWLSDEEKKKVSILVGHDDEVWDFGIVIDYQYFLREINQFIYDKPILF